MELALNARDALEVLFDFDLEFQILRILQQKHMNLLFGAIITRFEGGPRSEFEPCLEVSLVSVLGDVALFVIRRNPIQILIFPGHLDQPRAEILEGFLLFEKILKIQIVGGGLYGVVQHYGIGPELHEELSLSLFGFAIQSIFFHDSVDFPFHELILVEFPLLLHEELVHLLGIQPLLLVDIREDPPFLSCVLFEIWGDVLVSLHENARLVFGSINDLVDILRRVSGLHTWCKERLNSLNIGVHALSTHHGVFDVLLLDIRLIALELFEEDVVLNQSANETVKPVLLLSHGAFAEGKILNIDLKVIFVLLREWLCGLAFFSSILIIFRLFRVLGALNRISCEFFSEFTIDANPTLLGRAQSQIYPWLVEFFLSLRVR